jgi:Glyoxalase/Bleomycin resistance protein/Dioxygenase superfamily
MSETSPQPASPARVDHIALQVSDIDRRVASLVATGVLRVLREGVQYSTGQRIVMVGDGSGFKLELIESPEPAPIGFAHLALRVSDVEAEQAELVQQGWTSKRSVHELSAAKARTALLSDGDLDLQVISYGPGSPDMATW